MSETGGLRERKRQEMHQRLSEVAIALFLERGFEKVSVAEVAAAAGVSKPTLFRYFAAKEDLVVHRFADHEDEAARVVAGRTPGSSPLDALHRHFLEALDRHDPVTGLSDDPQVLEYLQLLYGTPALTSRLHSYQRRSERALAEALAGDGAGATAEPPVGARLAAGQIVVVLRILGEENARRMSDGESAERVHREAVAAVEAGFDQLRRGLLEFA
jgi:AcrR family transcriptional regulator